MMTVVLLSVGARSRRGCCVAANAQMGNVCVAAPGGPGHKAEREFVCLQIACSKEDQVANKRDALRRAEFPNTKSTVLNYLYWKGVLGNERPSVRRAYFSALISRSRQVVEARRRVELLMKDCAGDVCAHAAPKGIVTLQDACDRMPEWRGRVVDCVKKFLVQRVQAGAGGLCYMHAAIALQSYLVSQCTQQQAAMVDMARMVRDDWNGAQLAGYIFGGTGDNSETFFRSILQPQSIATVNISICDGLSRYGPGLVIRFQLREEFVLSTSGRLRGRAAGTVVGRHSMVMIGWRQDAATGEMIYLLQNWWRDAQFIEVSEEYFDSAGGMVLFVMTPQSSIPERLATCATRYAENELDKEGSDDELEGI